MELRSVGNAPTLRMRKGKITFWLKQSVSAQIGGEASARYPLESGGVVMGYWADTTNIVATSCLGPGPNAKHQTHEFTPDHDWQTERIADHYHLSGRTDAYLGDWHSHPDIVNPHMSWKDRSTLRRIARHAPARAPTPLMLIAAGQPNQWSISVWIGKPRRFMTVPAWFEITQALVRMY